MAVWGLLGFSGNNNIMKGYNDKWYNNDDDGDDTISQLRRKTKIKTNSLQSTSFQFFLNFRWDLGRKIACHKLGPSNY